MRMHIDVQSYQVHTTIYNGAGEGLRFGRCEQVAKTLDAV